MFVCPAFERGAFQASRRVRQFVGFHDAYGLEIAEKRGIAADRRRFLAVPIASSYEVPHS